LITPKFFENKVPKIIAIATLEVMKGRKYIRSRRCQRVNDV
jgi:hypothetical protein